MNLASLGCHSDPSAHVTTKGLRTKFSLMVTIPKRPTTRPVCRRGTEAATLEGNPEPEFDLPGGAERIDSSSHAYAVDAVSSASRAVDLTGGSR